MHREFVALLALAASAFAQKNPFDVDALLSLATHQRSADFARWTHGRVHRAEHRRGGEQASRSRSGWCRLMGGLPRRITNDGESNERPRWSPDSKSIAFVSDRGGSSQIWLMNPDGSGAKQVTNLSTEADGVLFSPDGKNLLFTSEVFPECTDDACNKQKLEAEKSSKVNARIYDGLLYRHWTQWQTKRRSHLMVVPVAGGTGQGSHAGRDARCAAVFAGRPGRLRHLPRRQGGLLRDECRPGAGHQHEFRSLRGFDRRRPVRRKSP